ncbi:protein translocase subunit SecD [Skermania piniformis]|uniref:Protein translocase subunit SecD n=1 Tax=Skermania pinensis TaxID=39122 RepID=A0ABX8SC29_9ACTN|nr:protein translocase subunit SecD [Skermania piniformis]QXQ15419.1 protein translocase subunit SecD [Skermania piniformis]
MRRRGSAAELWALAAFAALVAAVYGMVFFLGDRSPTPELGIDLQGGTRVTLTARTPDGSRPSQDSLRQAQSIIETRVNGLGVSGSEVVIDGDNLVITVPGDDSSQARTLGQTARMFIRPVLATQPAVGAGKQPAPESGTGSSSAEAAAQIQQAKAQRQSTDEATQKAALAALDCSKPDPLQGNDDPALPLVACSTDGTKVDLLGPSIIDGQEIADASSGFDQQQSRYIVSLEFKSGGSETWAKFTSENIGKQAAFTLDSKVVSDPVIQGATPAGSATQITGNFTAAEAKSLANTLKYGSLPLSFASSEAETVSATLGLASLRAGLLAAAVGLGLVLLYCLLYYRALGLLTALSLILSGVAIYGILVLLGRWINFTLDLAGIAGLIIGIGMTADSFVVFFERIKDEMREGRSFRSAVPRGWARARRTILSGNAVSFIAAAVLYTLALGQVRGFAFTLGLTTILDVIVVFLVTAPLVTLASRSPFWSRPSVNGLGAVQQVARERKAATVVAAKEARL